MLLVMQQSWSPSSTFFKIYWIEAVRDFCVEEGECQKGGVVLEIIGDEGSNAMFYHGFNYGLLFMFLKF